MIEFELGDEVRVKHIGVIERGAVRTARPNWRFHPLGYVCYWCKGMILNGQPNLVEKDVHLCMECVEKWWVTHDRFPKERQVIITLRTRPQQPDVPNELTKKEVLRKAAQVRRQVHVIIDGVHVKSPVQFTIEGLARTLFAGQPEILDRALCMLEERDNYQEEE